MTARSRKRTGWNKRRREKWRQVTSISKKWFELKTADSMAYNDQNWDGRICLYLYNTPDSFRADKKNETKYKKARFTRCTEQVLRGNIIPRLIKPGGPMPHSQRPSNNSYPEPNQSNSSYWCITILFFSSLVWDVVYGNSIG